MHKRSVSVKRNTLPWLQPRGGWWRYYELCIHMNWGDCIVLYDHMGFTRPCVGCTLFSCHLSWHCTQHKKQQYIVFNPSRFFFFLASEGIVVMLLSLLYLFQFYKMSLFTIPSCLHCTLEALHNGSFFDRVDQSIKRVSWTRDSCNSRLPLHWVSCYSSCSIEEVKKKKREADGP